MAPFASVKPRTLAPESVDAIAAYGFLISERETTPPPYPIILVHLAFLSETD